MKTNKQNILSFSILMALSSSSIIAKEVHINLPDVPLPPKVTSKVVSAVKVVVHNSQFKDSTVEDENKTIKKGILFSKRVPPTNSKKIVETKVEESQTTKIDSPVGEVIDNRVSVYLIAKLISVDDVISKLKDADFKILTQYALDKKKDYISVVFTNDDIIKSASKLNRGFASSIRLIINKKDMTVSIINPLFLMKAFMQKDYDETLANETLSSIKEYFKDIKDSSQLMKFSHLPKYQFMTSMPYYNDMFEVASNTNASLLAKARNSKKIIFEQKLENGSVLLGVKLSTLTHKFVKKIGYEGAELLPYPILIENNKAKILAPKYYIALLYPSLSMSQFMGIATIPGAIEKDCNKVFR